MSLADTWTVPTARRLRASAVACACTVVALVAAVAPCCRAIELQQGTVVTLRSFRTQGRGEHGARWFLEGEQAIIRGTVVDLTGATVRLVGEEGRTARITSEHCTYHQESGLLESAAAVRVESGDAVLAGVGFDMLMSERRLRIRDAVRMELPQRDANLSVVVPGPAAKTPGP